MDVVDLIDLIDLFGEGGAAAVGGAAVGAMFGALSQKSRFCLRAATVEFARGQVGARTAVWLLVFSAALFSVQALIASGELSVVEARQLASRASLSGAIIGGALFGVGMVLARGCASRLLVLSANGNLRALLSGLVFAVVAQASLRGVLAPLRESIAGLWTLDDAASRDLLAVVGASQQAGFWFATVWLVGAFFFAWRNRLSITRAAAALGVGAMVAAGWLFTCLLSQQTFEPTQVESLTFTGPSADTLMFVLNGANEVVDFDVGLVPGVFLGSFLMAAWARELKFEGFDGPAAMRRYLAGAVLMGFGGMLAGGCAVGAGVTGGAIFALASWATLLSMWIAAGLTDRLVDGGPAPAAHAISA